MRAQRTLSPHYPRYIIARGDKVIPIGPNDFRKQMHIEARIRFRRNRRKWNEVSIPLGKEVR